jgi:RNA polymerase sigma factor (sigma-70 family)
MPDPKPIRHASAPTGSEATALSQYAPLLFRFLLNRLRRSDAATYAEDLLQQVFLRFWQSPQRELVRKPDAYLYRIAEHVLSEFLLRRSRSLVTFDSEAVEQMADEPVAGGDWREGMGDQAALEQQLERVLAQIPPMYRAVLILSTRDGLTYAEISKRLNITEKTAKTYFSRALACCRAADWNR